MNYLSEPRVGKLNYHDLGAIRSILLMSNQIELEYAMRLSRDLMELQREHYSEEK